MLVCGALRLASGCASARNVCVGMCRGGGLLRVAVVGRRHGAARVGRNFTVGPGSYGTSDTSNQPVSVPLRSIKQVCHRKRQGAWMKHMYREMNEDADTLAKRGRDSGRRIVRMYKEYVT